MFYPQEMNSAAATLHSFTLNSKGEGKILRIDREMEGQYLKGLRNAWGKEIRQHRSFSFWF